MRKFLLSLMLMVFIAPLALRADEVIVGTADGTSTLVVPFRNNQTASYTQSIYPQAEVGGAMTITAVAFSCNTPNQTTTSNVKIYIGETDKTTHANSSDWITDEEGRTLVYEGAVTLGGEEWENLRMFARFRILLSSIIPKWRLYTNGKKSSVCGDRPSGRQPVSDRHPSAL